MEESLSVKKHREWNGKIEIMPKAPVDTLEELSVAYTPKNESKKESDKINPIKRLPNKYPVCLCIFPPPSHFVLFCDQDRDISNSSQKTAP